MKVVTTRTKPIFKGSDNRLDYGSGAVKETEAPSAAASYTPLTRLTGRENRQDEGSEAVTETGAP